VAVSLAAETGRAVIATDLSRDALLVAHRNALRLQDRGRVALVRMDLLSGFRRPIDVLLANLPYIPRDRPLPREVRDFEPHLALFSGPTGVETITRLLRDAVPLLAGRAVLAVEMDEEAQTGPVSTVARALYPEARVDILRDGGGYERVVRIERR
jgi:release factor glutamine methyltransferase